MTYDEYQNKRSWLVDTAETPADQKRLKAQLEKLKAQYEAGKKAAATKKPDPSNTKPFNVRLIKPSEIIKDKPKAKAKAATADDARMQATQRAQMLRGESAEDKAYRTLMEKYNYDVTKIPGFKSGRGTR
jgi:hypothetical protein